MGAWGLTENVSGSDAAVWKQPQKKKGFYILNGSKTFITHGGVGETAVVTAVTDKSKGTKGISAFILEKGYEGFKVGKKENKLGMRSSDTCELIFENCKVPAENLIGNEGEGFKQAMQFLTAEEFLLRLFQWELRRCIKILNKIRQAAQTVR